MLHKNEALLIVCDLNGIIREIKYNNIDSEFYDIKGKLFFDLFSTESMSKAMNLFVDIKKNSASFGWDLMPKIKYSSELFYFGGAIIDDEITILGTKTQVDFTKFLTGLTQLNNEQINRIRILEKEKANSPDNINRHYLNEMSRLNNELVGMQRELSKKNVELAQLNNIKNQFLGMAAHDLRNPLGYVINYSEFLEEENNNLTSEQIDFISQIKNLCSFMLNLVTDLLDVSAIEAGEVNLKTELIDIVHLVDYNIQLNRILSEKKNITLNYIKPIDSIFLYLDKSKIEQVVSNLVSNAIKYSNKKTEITVTVMKENNDVIFSVKDNGQGIKKEELELLFKPFKKTSSKSTNGEKSTGLGLFIVKRIVDAHGGRIWVESNYGTGSIFYVSLPIAEK